MIRLALALALLAPACATLEEEERPDEPVAARAAPPKIELTDDAVWVAAGGERWKLPAPRDEIVLSPSQRRWAAVDLDSGAPPTQVLIRSLRGRVVARCPIGTPGMPRDLAWIGDRQLGYVAPKGPGRPSALYRVHDARTGRLVSERAGSAFAWDAGHRRLAYLARDGQAVAVGDKEVYPRAPGAPTRFRGPIAWSPDGNGLAFIEVGQGKGAVTRLVVMVEISDEGGDATWEIPREATAPSLRVFWAAANKVVIGENALQPKFAANWERVQ